MGFAADDHRHMGRALQLAARGLRTTMPNPRVGCVIAHGRDVVGEGWHERAGGPHAEAVALRVAGERAPGATAYVTLEPCSHHGRTPPCADSLLASGIARVVAAMEDPNPDVSGRGFARLRAAGVVVEKGLMEAAARDLNPGFVSRMTRGRPWIRLKVAQSLDGRTAAANGASQWITGPAARRDGHRWRARSCVVMTGIGTLRDDDPRLTVRDIVADRQPLRVVVDSQLRIAPGARIFDGGAVVVATAVDDASRRTALEAAGAEVWHVPDARGRVDLVRLAQRLGAWGANEVLVEAGINLHSALIAAGLVDEIVLYVAPKLVGDSGRGVLRLPELSTMDDATVLDVRDVRHFGPDLRLVVRPVGARP
ncbi:MAG: bifunctional diaminohydroxyphosphoribosylaminopyrimidine deaminase/5-amino-6-(5-phosphoribosylamino)uracil reductase RibD [Burkholderiales bacterium]|nr:bifunctional diaminohydroxyphosphoribosylaminopyrimidine deaminase/5-amino-6-(5-phosphoribosylamino)uracil reductase RibD [Burkholderiales bacterium]